MNGNAQADASAVAWMPRDHRRRMGTSCCLRVTRPNRSSRKSGMVDQLTLIYHGGAARLNYPLVVSPVSSGAPRL